MILLALLLQAAMPPASVPVPAPDGSFIPIDPAPSADQGAHPVPHAPPTIRVQRASDNAPLIWMGIVAAGAAPDLAKLDAAASTRGFTTTQPSDGTDTPSLLIMFDADTKRPDAAKLYKDIAAGTFGTLDTQFAVLPQAEASIIPLPTDDIHIEPASYVKGVE